MQTANESLFSLTTLNSFFTGRRKSEVAFPDGSSETGNHNVGFVRMAKLTSVEEEVREPKMNVTHAGNPPPLPPRSGDLPPLSLNRKVSASSMTSSTDNPPTPPHRNTSLPKVNHTLEFESRFRFHPLSSLPPPEPVSDSRKTYPSQMQKTVRRPTSRDSLPSPPSQPPPPPPR